MREVPIYRRDGQIVAHALVDDADYDRVSAYTWRRHGEGYAIAAGGKRGDQILMHRLILGLPIRAGRGGLHTDHVDRNRLNNQRGNLRAVPQAVNNRNVEFVGVGRHGRKWRAWTPTPTRYLGVFNTREEAEDALRLWRETGGSAVNRRQTLDDRASPCCGARVVRNGYYRGIRRFRCEGCRWTFKETEWNNASAPMP